MPAFSIAEIEEMNRRRLARDKANAEAKKVAPVEAEKAAPVKKSAPVEVKKPAPWLGSC